MKVRPRAYKQMFFIRSFPHMNSRDLFQFVPSLCNFYNRALFTYFGEIIISNSTQYLQNVFFSAYFSFDFRLSVSYSSNILYILIIFSSFLLSFRLNVRLARIFKE